MDVDVGTLSGITTIIPHCDPTAIQALTARGDRDTGATTPLTPPGADPYTLGQRGGADTETRNGRAVSTGYNSFTVLDLQRSQNGGPANPTQILTPREWGWAA